MDVRVENRFGRKSQDRISRTNWCQIKGEKQWSLYQSYGEIAWGGNRKCKWYLGQDGQRDLGRWLKKLLVNQKVDDLWVKNLGGGMQVC